MAALADEAVQVASDPDKLSFYGLNHWLNEISTLLDRIDEASLAKAPSSEDQKLTEQKDEILEAQSRLRRAMGSHLESPSFTKRERPMAEEFLKQQLSKLEKGLAVASGAAAPKAQRAIEKLKLMQEELVKKKPALETREVQEIQASMVAAEADWKQVAPLYEKWEKGKHTFKTNADLQAMKRTYDDARKARERGPERLEQALRSSREGKQLAVPVQDNAPPKGWFSATAPRKAAPTAGRPKATARAVQPNSWGSVMNFAQRLRAEAGAQVRREVEEGEEDDDDEEDEAEETAAAAPPVQAAKPAVRPKAPPSLQPQVQDDGFKAVKPGRAAPPRAPQRPAPAEDDDDDDEAAEEEANRATANRPAAYSASAKKKGKAGKTKAEKRAEKKAEGGQEEDDDEVPESDTEVRTAKPVAAPWAATMEAAVSGSVLQDLCRSETWCSPADEDSAVERLECLTERLSWVSPLGLVLPLEWKEFVSMEMDGGPRRTSRKGVSPWVGRVQKNVASLLVHYLTIIFGCTLLHSLSAFGLLLWGVVLQVGLILAPPDVSFLKSPVRVMLLQVAHVLLWILFVRSIWQMHFFIKCFAVMVVGGHAYVVVPMGED